MKKRVTSFLLIFVMMASAVVLASCSQETDIVEQPAKVYTLYTICEDGTTQQAIKEVELALNRMVFNEKKLNLKLVMVPESEYDALIAEKLEECKKYDEERKNKAKNKNKDKNESGVESGAESSAAESSGEESVDVFTGDDYIDMLQANLDAMERGEEYVEYELEIPRLDIFLVRGYDNYITLVGKDLLAALDDKLTSEAKIIKDYVYPTFLEAAKVTNSKGTRKTYGVPMNKGIGEYEYIVFDKEYLDKYRIDAGTMTNLEDLEYYLEILAENEPDIVPLANVFDSPDFAYLFEPGFSTYISDKHVVNTYEDLKALAYFTMIARYRTMGYLKDDPGDTGWAVKFLRGTNADLEALAARTGRDYDYTIHSYPVATNEDLLGSLFCVSAYTVSNELTDVMEILSYLESNTAMANTLAYGVEGVHYELNEETGQVKKISNEYNYERDYVGNTFLTTTLEGENPNKWEQLKLQNRDSAKTADQSASVGFAYYPVDIKDPNDSSITYSEPDYIEIIQKYCNQFYPEIIAGNLVNIKFEDLKELVTPTITDSQKEEVINRYTNALNAEVIAEIAAKYAPGTSLYEKISKLSAEKAYTNYNTRANRTKIKAEVRKQVADDPLYNESEETITARVDEICTDAYYEEQVRIIYADKIEERKNTLINNSVEDEINKKSKAYFAGEEYAARLDAALNSTECLAELEHIDSLDVFVEYPEVALEKTNLYLQTELTAKIGEAFEEMNVALRKAYKEFADSYLNRYDFSDESKRSEPDFRKAIINAMPVRLRNSLKSELRKMCAAELGEGALSQDISDLTDERFTDEWIQDVIIETFKLNKDPSATFEKPVSTPELRDIVNNYLKESDVKSHYENSLIATFEKAVGLIKTVEPENADLEEEESSEETEPAEGDDTGETKEETEKETDSELVDLETVDLYAVIFKKRIENQYYKYAPLPTG